MLLNGTAASTEYTSAEVRGVKYIMTPMPELGFVEVGETFEDVELVDAVLFHVEVSLEGVAALNCVAGAAGVSQSASRFIGIGAGAGAATGGSEDALTGADG